MSDDSPKNGTPHGPQLIARDRRVIFGSASLAVAGQLAGFAAGIACTIITIRLLDQAAYGRFAIFFMLLETISHILSWPDPGFVRFGRNELAEEGHLVETFWARMFLFLLSVVVVAVLLFGIQEDVGNYVELEFPVHLLLLFYVVLNCFVLLTRSVFQTATRFRAYAITQFGVKVLNFLLILTVFALLAKPVSPAHILVVHIISFAVISCVCLALIPWKSLLPVRIRFPAIRRMVAYSWPFLPVGLSALVVNWADLAIIKHFAADAAMVGLYAAAYQPVMVLIALQMAVGSAVLPLLVSLAIEKRGPTLKWYLDDALLQIGWAIGLGSLVLAMAAESIPLVLGSQYGGAVVPCQVLLAGVGFFMFAGFQTALAKALDCVKALFLIGLLTAVLNVAFDFVLVPRFGIRGAAIATTAAFILSGLLFFPVLNTAAWLRGSAPLRRYGALAGLAAPLFLAAAALTCENWAARLGIGFVVLLVWIIAARVAGVFRKETLKKLDQMRMPNAARRTIVLFYALLGR